MQCGKLAWYQGCWSEVGGRGRGWRNLQEEEIPAPRIPEDACGRGIAAVPRTLVLKKVLSAGPISLPQLSMLRIACYAL